MQSVSLRTLALSVLLIAAGCSNNSSVNYNDVVEGVVKMDDQPVGGAIVTFIPEITDTDNRGIAAPTSSATTDDQGQYKLMCVNQHPGAVIGKHKVIVSRGRAADPGHRGEKDVPSGFNDQRPIPSIYKSPTQTTLRAVVTDSKHNGYDFEIKSGK